MPNVPLDLANQACDDAFKDGITKLASFLQQSLITANSDADKDAAKQRFRDGLKAYRDIRQTCVEIVVETYG